MLLLKIKDDFIPFSCFSFRVLVLCILAVWSCVVTAKNTRRRIYLQTEPLLVTATHRWLAFMDFERDKGLSVRQINMDRPCQQTARWLGRSREQIYILERWMHLHICGTWRVTTPGFEFISNVSWMLLHLAFFFCYWIGIQSRDIWSDWV